MQPSQRTAIALNWIAQHQTHHYLPQNDDKSGGGNPCACRLIQRMLPLRIAEPGVSRNETRNAP